MNNYKKAKAEKGNELFISNYDLPKLSKKKTKKKVKILKRLFYEEQHVFDLHLVAGFIKQEKLLQKQFIFNRLSVQSKYVLLFPQRKRVSDFFNQIEWG